tara:strand:+ start:2369 stop:3898 length:1530 start_codon:yes stop_codon:yes gene_type:complete
MAGATITTLDAVLKNYYLGPIQEQLNNSVLCLEMFEKYTVDWHGKQCVIPVHISRNSSASGLDAYVDEGGTLPSPGAQGYADLNVTAKFQYGKFALTGQAIASARKGGSHTFISWMDSEMKKLVEDFRVNANKATIHGGPVRGFIIERTQGSGNTAAAQSVAAGLAAAARPFETIPLVSGYDGDFSLFTGCVATDQTTWVRVQLTRLDTYNEIDRTGVTTGANANWFVSAADVANGTLTINFGTNSAGGDAYTASLIEDGRAIALSIHPTQGVDAVGVNFGAAPPAATKQPNGMFTNMGSRVHYGTSRNAADATAAPVVAAAGEAPILRSHVITAFAANDNTGAGGGAAPVITNGRVPLTLNRIQQSLDLTIADSTSKAVDGGGVEPDVFIMHPSMRQAYTSLFTANASMVLNSGQSDKPTKLIDGGFLDISYSGIPIKVSRAMASHMVVMLKMDTWCLTELQAPGFADLDGNVLSRTVNADRFEGYYRWYYNQVCKRPNNNVILCGIS